MFSNNIAHYLKPHVAPLNQNLPGDAERYNRQLELERVITKYIDCLNLIKEHGFKDDAHPDLRSRYNRLFNTAVVYGLIKNSDNIHAKPVFHKESDWPVFNAEKNAFLVRSGSKEDRQYFWLSPQQARAD